MANADINTSRKHEVITDIVPATDFGMVSISAALRRMSFYVLGQAIGFLQGGTGASSSRRMQDKVREIQLSVLDFGAARSPTAPSASAATSDTAFTNAMAYAIGSSAFTNVIHIPSGYYRLANSLEIPANGDLSVNLVGDGQDATHIYCNTTSTTALACVTTVTGVNNRAIVIGMSDIHWHWYGTQTRTSLHGILITHKVNMVRVRWDNFPGDGGKYETSLATNNTWCVFFGKIVDTVFENNGRYGCNLRFGANANLFIGCTFRGNASDGLIHQQDATGVDSGGNGSIYGNVFFSCNADNNGGYGWNLVNGTNVHMYGCGAIGNGAADDVYVGDNCLRSWVGMNRLSSTGQVRLPGFNSNVIQIWYGGQRLFGAT